MDFQRAEMKGLRVGIPTLFAGAAEQEMRPQAWAPKMWNAVRVCAGYSRWDGTCPTVAEHRLAGGVADCFVQGMWMLRSGEAVLC